MCGKLYLCATPIGNLEDITLRVLRTLKEVDLIAAEDTRNSIKLLNHFDIKTPMTSYHEYNKIDKGSMFWSDKMQEGTEYCSDHRCRNSGNFRSGRGTGTPCAMKRELRSYFASGTCCLYYSSYVVRASYETVLHSRHFCRQIKKERQA